MKRRHLRQKITGIVMTGVSVLTLLSELPTAHAQNGVTKSDVFLEGRRIQEAARESESRRKMWSTITKLAMAGAAITLLVNNWKKKKQ